MAPTLVERRIAVITGTRADYGLLRHVVRDLRASRDVACDVVATAAHLSTKYGGTVDELRADGITPIEVPTLGEGDAPLDIAQAIARGVLGVSRVLTDRRPDLVVVLGDRFETLAAAIAASALGLPIAHIRGGEVTEGAQDDAWRHAITKLSHLHFVATEAAGKRVRQLGEEPWRVHVVGEPGLDRLVRDAGERLDRGALARDLGIALRPPVIAVTYHPATLDPLPPTDQADRLVAALARLPGTIVITAPNADSGGAAIRERLERFVSAHRERAAFAVSLGSTRYFSLLAVADAMVGNSSSGIVEALGVPEARLNLPVVNIGSRQSGRERAERGVIDAACETEAIVAATSRVLDPAFRMSLKGVPNPYGDGHSSERIVKVLREVELGHALVNKRFADR